MFNVVIIELMEYFYQKLPSIVLSLFNWKYCYLLIGNWMTNSPHFFQSFLISWELEIFTKLSQFQRKSGMHKPTISRAFKFGGYLPKILLTWFFSNQCSSDFGKVFSILIISPPFPDLSSVQLWYLVICFLSYKQDTWCPVSLWKFLVLECSY